MATSESSERPVSIYAYPWDLYDEGPEAAAERLAASGFNTVHLAVSYHLAGYLLPRNPRRSVYFGNGGGVYFRPDTTHYRESVLPVVSPETVEVADNLPRLLRALRAAGLSPRAWVVYCYNHSLGSAHPHLTKVDALGNVYTAQLCVGNPVVQAYARGLTADVLGNYDFDGLFVESLCYMPYRYGLVNAKAAVVPSERAAFLLGLCFCGGCTAAARAEGVDVDRLRAAVADWLQVHFSRLPDEWEESLKPDEEWVAEAFDGILAAFLAVRSRVAARVIHEVLDVAVSAVSAAAVPDGTRRPHPILECFNDGGILPADAAGVRGRLHEDCVVIAPGAQIEKTAALCSQKRAAMNPGARVIGALYPAAFGSPESLKECLETGAAAGVDGWRVYNYGILSERQLSWIKRARWT